jgi:hypothetical protein
MENTQPVLDGTYTVIRFGGTFIDDPETVAILVRDGGPYSFEPYAPEYRYSMKHKVPAAEALDLAVRFAADNTPDHRWLTSRILAPDGSIVGYEVVPLLPMIAYGTSVTSDITYALKGERVIVYIRIKDEVAARQRTGSSSDRDQ